MAKPEFVTGSLITIDRILPAEYRFYGHKKLFIEESI
jgi:hypothetical protein